MILYSVLQDIKIKILIYLNKLHTLFLSHNKGVVIGEGSVVYYKSRIDCYSQSYNNNGGILIGKNCRIGCRNIRYHCGMPFYTSFLADGVGSKISVGDNCRVNGAYIHAEKSISIGNNCVIASGVNIVDSNGHVVNSSNRTSGRDVPHEIVIGNNVWICMNATILKGSVIGDNSIISAGSVIQGVIPPNSIASTTGELSIKEIRM
ncbi:Acetyltransferase (isoleucine patch superfamily) [Prevotellaceae bacterium MN60]|nr:Acetyltransferase (isoleucine patch superfamily) [Prevotellaceae bacterium MN60]